MSNEIGVKLNESNLTPGATVSGRAGWQLEKQPRRVEIRLFWRTSGRGTKDTELVNEMRIDDPGTQGLQEFRFELPVEPYSYHGQLISVRWGVEIVAGKFSDLAEFVMAPDGIVCDLSGYRTSDEQFE